MEPSGQLSCVAACLRRRATPQTVPDHKGPAQSTRRPGSLRPRPPPADALNGRLSTQGRQRVKPYIARSTRRCVAKRNPAFACYQRLEIFGLPANLDQKAPEGTPSFCTAEPQSSPSRPGGSMETDFRSALHRGPGSVAAAFNSHTSPGPRCAEETRFEAIKPSMERPHVGDLR